MCSGVHFVWRSGMICVNFLEEIMRNIYVQLFKFLTRGSGENVI